MQSSEGLPESGVSDIGTWLALLGPSAQPGDILSVVRAARQGDGDDDGDESAGFGDDMTESNGRGVWLLGEQRWEKKQGPNA